MYPWLLLSLGYVFNIHPIRINVKRKNKKYLLSKNPRAALCWGTGRRVALSCTTVLIYIYIYIYKYKYKYIYIVQNLHLHFTTMQNYAKSAFA